MSDNNTIVITRAEVLGTLDAMEVLLKEYGELMDRVSETGEVEDKDKYTLNSHKMIVENNSQPFHGMMPVAVLLRYLLDKYNRDTLTFRVPVNAELLPEEENSQIAELSRYLLLLRPSLDAALSDMMRLSRQFGGVGNSKSQMMLSTFTSLFKAIIRQDWMDVEMCMNHLNMVSTTKESHELVRHVAKIIRNIYDSLNELSQDYSDPKLNMGELSSTTQEIPDAVEKLYLVIDELEGIANRNLDILEALNNNVNNDVASVESAMEVIGGCQGELATLIEQNPELSGDIQPLLDLLKDDVGAKLTVYRDNLKANSEVYMTLFANQSYQDLTGQTLKKVIAFTESLQYQLLKIITKEQAASVPEVPERRVAVDEHGPDAQNRLNQDKVDDLLAELGF